VLQDRDDGAERGALGDQGKAHRLHPRQYGQLSSG
jgi:hypothetical protein